jgi:UDP-N-acetylglucosamine acyltransferase
MIHPSAVIDPGAELGTGVRVGAFTYVGPNVRVGDDCELRERVTLVGHTHVGQGCVFFPGSVIGEAPQDIKYKGEHTKTIIGDDNHFRENVTIHSGTGVGGGETRIGNHNRFLVGVHVAHDCMVGNHVIIANNVQLAGHILIEDHVTMGGGTVIHHFVTIGTYSMLGGLSRVAKDAPPYFITTGYPAKVRGVNGPGLKRWGLSTEDIDQLNAAYRDLYGRRGRVMSFAERLEQLTKDHSAGSHVHRLCGFLHRSINEGKHGRYLESKRQDTDKDRADFYAKTVGEC